VQLEYEKSIALAEAFCSIVDTGVASSNKNAAAAGQALQTMQGTTSSNSLASLRILSASLTQCAEKFQELVLGARSLGGSRESAVRHGAGLPWSTSLLFLLLASFDPPMPLPNCARPFQGCLQGICSHSLSHRRLCSHNHPRNELHLQTLRLECWPRTTDMMCLSTTPRILNLEQAAALLKM
jgi:hypothetical protein